MISLSAISSSFVEAAFARFPSCCRERSPEFRAVIELVGVSNTERTDGGVPALDGESLVGDNDLARSVLRQSAWSTAAMTGTVH